MIGSDYPQVGQGWAFPPRWTAAGDGVAGDGVAGAGAAVPRLVLSAGARRIREAIEVLLRTPLGSRVMRPDVGVGIDRFGFEPRTAEACHRLADDVRRALALGEPRIIVDSVEAAPAGAAADRIDVTIEYRIDRHRRPESMVVPFYVAGAG